MQILIQTTNYYAFAQNTALTFGDTFLHIYGPVGIAHVAHIFPLFRPICSTDEGKSREMCQFALALKKIDCAESRMTLRAC
jgi:hypothetical protein